MQRHGLVAGTAKLPDCEKQSTSARPDDEDHEFGHATPRYRRAVVIQILVQGKSHCVGW